MRAAGLEDFSEASTADPALLAVSRLVTYEVDPDTPYPAAFTGHVRLHYRDGSIVEKRQGHLRGGKEAPLSRGEIDAKFAANSRFGGFDAVDRLLATTESILSDDGGYEQIARLGSAP